VVGSVGTGMAWPTLRIKASGMVAPTQVSKSRSAVTGLVGARWKDQSKRHAEAVGRRKHW
jgi:hypothetical protein